MHQDACQSHRKGPPCERIWKRADQTDTNGEANTTGYGWNETENCLEHDWSPSQPLLRTTGTAWERREQTMGTAWERREQTMSQGMRGARTVMTSNAFIRTISVIIMLFSLRIYNWTMTVHIVEFFFLYRNQVFH